MRNAILLLCFCLTCLGCIAQKPKYIPSIPIYRGEAMKFKTLNEVFAIPAEYQVKDYKVIYSYKHGKVDSPGLIKDISSLFRYTETGDWVTFTGITITNGDKEIKLDDKCYVIK